MNNNEPRYGYMCSITFDHELGEALGGSIIYPSIEDLKDNHIFTSCGITKVRIEFEEEIEIGEGDE